VYASVSIKNEKRREKRERERTRRKKGGESIDTN